MRAATAARPERAVERVGELAVRLAAHLADAVDALEVAARLEADGINDALAAQRYGHKDVFALAETLYGQSVRSPHRREEAPARWRTTARHHLLRGALFGLPGLLYAAAGRTVNGHRALALIAFSLILAWAASEALSYLGYLRLGARDRPGAERALRWGMVAGLLLGVPGIVLAGHLLHLAPRTTMFAAGQAVYLLAATVVMVTGGERALFAALVPGAAAGVGQLLSARAGAIWNGAGLGGSRPRFGGPVWDGVIWAGVAATVAATVLLAILRTRRSGAAVGPWFRLGDLTRAVPHAAFGLCAGGLLTVGTVAALLGAAAADSTVMALPLSVSMGGAEWLLFRYRRRCSDLLLRCATLREFTRLARAALLLVLAVYLTLLTTIAYGVAWAGRATHTFDVTPRAFWTSVLMGGALFTALALRSCGLTAPVLTSCGLTVALEAGALLLLPAGLLRADLLQLLACGALFAVLLACAHVSLGRATRHR